uniref:Uncharacterized protein n=1 Tax=Cacopsylla melanoneura TaxID=428564 RepID=A0A8D8SSA5_9HEMI
MPKDCLVPIILLTMSSVYTVFLTPAQRNVHCEHRIRRDDTKAAAATTQHGCLENSTVSSFLFGSFLEEQLGKLAQKGDMKSVRTMREKIDKSRDCQKRHLAFSKRFFAAARKGHTLNDTGPEHETNMRHLATIAGFVAELRSEGLPEQLVQNRTADRLMEYWFTYVVKNKL